MQKYNKDNILKLYIELCLELNKTAGAKDINKAHKEAKIYCTNTIYKYYKSLTELQTIAGYELNSKTRKTIYTKENSLKMFSELYIKFGKRLDRTETRKELGLRDLNHIYRTLEVHSLDEVWEVIEEYLNNITELKRDFMGIYRLWNGAMTRFTGC